MRNNILGLHHITAIANSAQRNLTFYTSVLGLRLVPEGSFDFWKKRLDPFEGLVWAGCRAVWVVLYGSVIAFTGGLIGDKIYPENYTGDFEGTPVFIGTGNPDFHVPVQRVYASTHILKEMGAKVMERVYNNIGHTIVKEEIDEVNRTILAAVVPGG